jgi:UDP-N-acetylmuramate--alanine ligase
MSHTYTRTASLLDEFAASFDNAEVLILHKIYASAREVYTGGVNGKTLFEKSESLRKQRKEKNEAYYIEEHKDALDFLKERVRPGDIFITMGAGDNWKLCEALLKEKS